MSQSMTRPRRRVGIPTLIVLILAFFALAFAGLLRFFVADRLLVAPDDVYTRAELRALNASYFDRRALKVRTGATLTLTSTVRGNVKAAKDHVAVWDNFAVMEDLQNANRLEVSQQRMAFDRRTARMVNCCGATAVGTGGTRPIGLFFPIGVEKRSYDVYDPSTRRAWPMRYEATETVGGLRVYRFVQRVDETNVGQQPGGFPSSLLGIPGKVRPVPVNLYQRADVTIWLEPRSGVMVDRRQRVTSTLRSRDGQGRLVVADVDLRMREANRRDLAAQAEDAARSVVVLRIAGPAASLALGVFLLGLGAFMLVRRTRRNQPASVALR